MSPDYFNHLREEYFEPLYDLETNSGQYSIIQGELVEEIGSEIGGRDHRIGDTDAMQIARLLNRGKIEEAEELTEELLEE